MSTSIFSGSTLFLESIQQLGPATLRLKFSQDPLVVSSAGANDALNPSNYTLTGSVHATVSTVSLVSGDPQSVTLAISTPLPNETWRITCANIQTATANPLVSPTYLDFVTSPLNMQPSLASGATTDTAEDIIRKHLSSGLKGTNWNALISALAVGDTYVRNLAASAFNQLFKHTAGGKYLDKLASDDGFIRPSGVGISDDVFRKLAIKVGAEKLTLQSFLQVLETYYGSDALRATVDCVGVAPFSLQDGDDLLIEVEGTLVTVVFKDSHFAQTGQATAAEVASVITRAFQTAKLKAWAVPVVSPNTGNTIIRIYSGALGLRGALRILGGRSQLTLNFPTRLATTQAIGTTWTIDTPATISGLVSNRARLTYTGVGTNPTLQLVRVGDYVNLYGSAFNSLNRGHFTVIASTLTYVEIENVVAVNQIGVAQLATDDIQFYRPTRYTINSKGRISLAAQGSTGSSDVILAATTQAVGREVNHAAYLHDNTAVTLLNKSTAVSVARVAATVTINTTAAHGLIAGDTFYLAPGDPKTGQDFLNGIKTVVTAALATRLTYTEAGGAVSATLPQYIYPCYRNSAGLVTIKTASVHVLTSNDKVVLSDIIADTSVAPPQHTVVASSGFNALWYFAWAKSVKLQDGTVLECGGDIAGVFSAITKLYTPSTNSWAVLASMATARSKHTITLLSNGRVLVTGGNASAPIASCEIYDPTLAIWIPASPMSVARYAHTATLLNDGRVFVTGGGSATCEIFDPDTGIWTTVSSMAVNRFHHEAVLLQDGRVLVCGGYTVHPTALASSQVYNSYNDMWITAGNMTAARFHHRAILTRQIGVQGKVIVSTGTQDDTTSLTSFDIFEPMTLVWTASAAVDSTGRFRHAAIELTNGPIMLNGGLDAGSSIDNVGYYNPLTDEFSLIYAGSVGRATHNIFELSSGKVLLGPSNTNVTDTPELYDPQVGTYSSGGLNEINTITVLDTSRFTYQNNSYFSQLYR